ncbi:MAG: type II secretion system protein GspG [Luteolibacter sp.]
MKTNSRKGRAAFTLIELMAVITIIVILAGLVVGGLGYVSEKQASSKAKVQIALLSKALEEYKLDMGNYPATANSTTGTGTSAIYLYQALFKEGYDYTTAATPPTTWVNKATKIYLPELDPRTSKQGWVDVVTATTPPLSTTVKDPWGNEYRYRTAKTLAGVANTDYMNPDFDLWSCGKDGLTNPASPADTKNRDDIKNF